MYESYWGLTSKPFDNTPDPRFMFHSEKHEEALMRMIYAVHEAKEGAMLTGDYGCGKTVLSRALLAELQQDNRYCSVLILNPKITHNEFLKEVLYQLGEEHTARDRLSLQHQLGDQLNKIVDDGRRSIIIVDEAQVLGGNDFNDLRLLLNFQRNDRFLFTLILIGQTELKQKIYSIEPLKQRLATRFHLSPLDAIETAKYIDHRMHVAGREKPTFTQEAYHFVHRGSEGIPRRINNICDYCLLIGYGRRVETIEADIVIDTLKDLDEWREEYSQAVSAVV